MAGIAPSPPAAMLPPFDPSAVNSVLADVQTSFGTHERVVSTAVGPLVLVEQSRVRQQPGLA